MMRKPQVVEEIVETKKLNWITMMNNIETILNSDFIISLELL